MQAPRGWGPMLLCVDVSCKHMAACRKPSDTLTACNATSCCLWRLQLIFLWHPSGWVGVQVFRPHAAPCSWVPQHGPAQLTQLTPTNRSPPKRALCGWAPWHGTASAGDRPLPPSQQPDQGSCAAAASPGAAAGQQGARRSRCYCPPPHGGRPAPRGRGTGGTRLVGEHMQQPSTGMGH